MICSWYFVDDLYQLISSNIFCNINVSIDGNHGKVINLPLTLKYQSLVQMNPESRVGGFRMSVVLLYVDICTFIFYAVQAENNEFS